MKALKNWRGRPNIDYSYLLKEIKHKRYDWLYWGHEEILWNGSHKRASKSKRVKVDASYDGLICNWIGKENGKVKLSI